MGVFRQDKKEEPNAFQHKRHQIDIKNLLEFRFV